MTDAEREQLKSDGARLKEARIAAGLGQAELAYLMGRSRNLIADLERGHSAVTLSEAREIAEFCNTTVAFLAGEENYWECTRMFSGQVPFRR